MYLVRTKASELADFPGVNTPLKKIHKNKFKCKTYKREMYS